LSRKAEESGILSIKGFHICSAGHRYQGCLTTRDAEKLALKTGNPRAIFLARVFRAMTERWLGKPKEAVELTEGSVDAMLSVFDLDAVSAVIYIRGLALAEIGRIAEAMKMLNDGIHTCESLGGMVHLGRLYNCLGYCFMEILHVEQARGLNSRSRDLGRKLMEGYPAGRHIAAEIVAHANVNLMENLFDLGNSDAAWELMKSFEQESRGDDYTRSRDRWGSRMDALAATILLDRNDTAQAQGIVQTNLQTAKKEHVKKYKGRFLRLLGEVQMRRGEFENAIVSISEAIRILNEVGNPRLLWQAHGSLASAYERMGRGSEAREQWNVAADTIRKVGSGLVDRQLREGFLNARQIREILARSESSA
jgi:tetratricopeptide (TPR) repeat protein